MTSLYIHIPFCEKKCLYCSFVIAVAQRQRIDPYLDCLEWEAGRKKGKKVKTIYIGGGTPTFLSNDQLNRLGKIIESVFSYSGKAELTIEANPEGLDLEKAKCLFALGINRVSLGVQSFHDRYLKFLGRCHDSRMAVTAFHNLRKAGFDNINLDLMYSFPEQSLQEIREDVTRLVDLGSEHVSLYTFTVEPCSRFFAQGVRPQAGHDRAEQYEFAAHFLTQSGFRQYEISNFALSGRESQHNLNYWQGGNYFGLGVGAHSHIDGRRYWNVCRLNGYMSRIKRNIDPVEGSEDLIPQTRLSESLLLGLRMNEGVDLKKLEQRFECGLTKDKTEKIEEFVGNGLLNLQDGCLKATPQGRLVLDELAAYLI